MRITNKYNLPLSLVQAVSNDPYTKGDADISVTSLWKSPRIVVLEKEHEEKLERDVVDSLWSLLGRGVHDVLCRSDSDTMTEIRMSFEMEGWKISGQFDRYIPEQCRLQDYKVTSAWSLVYDSRNEDWENQLNTYAYMLHQNGYEVNNLEIIAVLRDWSQTEALRNQNYPSAPVVAVPVNLWWKTEAEERIKAQVLRQQAALKEIPLCTEKDQWARPGKFAVMKSGRKSAVKLYDSHAEALVHLSEDKDPKLSIVERKGVKTRCEQYCSVKNFCDQYRMESNNATDDLE
jgi:hypothetical protein